MPVVTFDASQVLRNVANLPGAHRRAISRALNKTAANVRTAASTAIRAKRSLSASTVRKALAIKQANPNRLVATLSVTGRPIPLKEYRANQTKRGVTVLVSPGKRKLVEHAGNKAFFIQKIGGHVFARQGKQRLPVKKLYGPSLPATFLNEEVRRAWTAAAQDALPKRLTEEIRFELNRIQDRAAAKRAFR
jgi:hypothetical protein